MRKVALVCLTCCLLIASTAWAQRKIVKVQGRAQPIIGELKETPGGYEILTEFGTVTVAKKDVISIEDYLSPQDEYQQRLNKLDPNDAEGHFELARWALQKNLLAAAQAEAEKAVQLKPDVAKYGWLLQDVKNRAQAAEAGKPATPATQPAVEMNSSGPLAQFLVSDEDVYHIRLEELSPKDTTAAVEFRNDVINRFIRTMAGTADFKDPSFESRFRGMSRLEQVRYILKHTDRNDTEFRNDILIKNDPKFMTEFRARVWPMLVQGCARADCHGGGEKPKGGLRLFTIAGNNIRADYTNFVILSTYEKDGKKLLDRSFPESSLVLQFGLPPEVAKTPHPRPIPQIFPAPTSTKYKTVFDWVSGLSGPSTPNYRLQWKAPLGMPLNLTGATGLPLPGAGTAPAEGETPLK